MESFPNLEDLILVKANKDQHVQTWRNHKIEWGKTVSTVERYIERESTVANSGFSKRGLTVWCLVPKDDKESLNFVCACETYRRPALISESNEKGREVRQTWVHSIASVFCPERFRRRGYAAHMMKKLHDELRKSEEPASFLYSDIGPKFYSESCKSNDGRGWNVKDPFEVVLESPNYLPKNDGDAVDIDDKDQTCLRKEDFEWVSELDLKLLMEVDMKKEEGSNKGSTWISVVPDALTYDWHLHRSLDEIVDNKSIDPNVWCLGYSIGNRGELNDWAFAVWTPHFKTNTLEILRLRLSNNLERRGQELRTLFTQAIKEAEKMGLKKVMAWNVPKDAASSIKVESIERTDELPSIAWYGEQSKEGDLLWKNNEKFAWV